jgi:hypothetical protein
MRAFLACRVRQRRSGGEKRRDKERARTVGNFWVCEVVGVLPIRSPGVAGTREHCRRRSDCYWKGAIITTGRRREGSVGRYQNGGGLLKNTLYSHC